MSYNWQHKNWPHFKYNAAVIEQAALSLSAVIGQMTGILHGLGNTQQQETTLTLLMSEALTTSAIEGEQLSQADVMSSIRNKLGINQQPEMVKDKRAKAIAAMLITVKHHYNQKLTLTGIKEWHALLFSEAKHINTGKWRTGKEPMQVISGSIGKEVIHFQAPPSEKVPAEMKQFVQWYNQYNVKGNLVQAIVKTAITHLYFESIHPFEDGNGRIGRALAEKCLSAAIGRPVLLSLSSVIEKNKKQYYTALKEAQSSLHIDAWLVYFAGVLVQAQTEAVNMVQFTVTQNKLLHQFRDALNTRQLKVIKKMMAAGSSGFQGGMTAKKYISITKASKATATRDLQQLAELGIFILKGAGRSTFYELTG